MPCVFKPTKVDCMKANNMNLGPCNRCGWNPVVEADRKAMDLVLRKGYIGSQGEIKDRRHKYRGIVLGKEKG